MTLLREHEPELAVGLMTAARLIRKTDSMTSDASRALAGEIWTQKSVYTPLISTSSSTCHGL